MQTFETSRTAKTLKVIGGLNKLADEYDSQNDPEIAAIIRRLASFPADDLADLYDLIVKHDTAQDAADKLAAA